MARGQGKRRTKAEKIAIAKKVCDTYAKGEHTIASILKKNGNLSDGTWSNWVNQIQEIKELYNKSKIEHDRAMDKKFMLEIKQDARKAMKRMINGHKVEIVKNEYARDEKGNVYLKSRKVEEKYIQPNATLIQVALYNTDSEHFQDRRNIDLNSSEGMTLDLNLNLKDIPLLSQNDHASPFELEGDWEAHEKYLELSKGGIEDIDFEEVKKALEKEKPKAKRKAPPSNKKKPTRKRKTRRDLLD